MDFPPIDDDRWARLLDDVVGFAEGITLLDEHTVVIDLDRVERARLRQRVTTEPSGRRSSTSS